MNRSDRYFVALTIFSIGYFFCLCIAENLRVGEVHITVNDVPHVWSPSTTPSSFWIYVTAVGVISLALAALGIYLAVSAYRFRDPSPPQSPVFTVFMRFISLWVLAGLIYVTYTFLRKWV